MATHAPITGALDCARPFALTTEQRAIAERTIERLISLLDADDGDPDLDGDDAEDEDLSYIALLVTAGPGCSISDAGGGDIIDERHDHFDEDREDDGLALRRPHRNRIRRTRCRKMSAQEQMITNRRYRLRPSSGLPTVLA